MRVRGHCIAALCACGSLMLAGCGSRDPLDAPIAIDTLTVQIADTTDLRLLGLGIRPAFVWRCGSFRITDQERSERDSVYTLIRAGGGVACQ